ncbi:MAG: FtsW/RodA/SpoVE family cell cycle protein [Thermoanaerobaculaceae bacterium]
MRRLDPWLILAIVALGAASYLAQFSTAQALQRPGSATRHLLLSLVSLALSVFVGFLDYRVLARFWPLFYLSSLITLLLLPVLAPLRAGTRAWLVLGPLSFQPSELARVVTILAVATVASSHKEPFLSGRKVVEITGLVAAPMALVLLQPDLGVALTYLPVLLAAFWIGGLRRNTWLALAATGLLGLVLAFAYALKPYQKERILTLFQPHRAPYSSGYQQRQAKIAVGSGGFTGKGIGSGTQSQLRFLPAQHTDLIFAVWAEETGFLGSTVVLGLYGLLLARILIAGITARDRLGALVAGCTGGVLAVQVIINVGMALGLTPTVGITLPFFSQGGSSLLASGLALGLVQSVWRLRFANL